jgi:hypothetical protein
MVKGNIATCLTNKDTFTQFVSQCLSDKDIVRTSTVIPGQDLKNLFIDQRAEASSLLQNLQSISDLKGQANLTSPDLNKQKNELDNTIQELTDKIQDVENQIEVANQTFIEKATNTPKSSQFLGNLQDISLGVFFLSLIILAIILAIIQFIKSNSLYEGLAAAFYTLAIFFIIIIVVYALLTEIA